MMCLKTDYAFFLRLLAKVLFGHLSYIVNIKSDIQSNTFMRIVYVCI